MRVGLSTWSLLNVELTRAIRLIGDAGAQSIELWGEPPHAFPGMTKTTAVRDALSSYSLKVSIHGPYHDLNLGSVYPGVSESVRKTLTEYVRFAGQLDATTVSFHPGSTMHRSLVDASIRSCCGILGTLVKETRGNLTINVENEPRDRSGFAFFLGSRSSWLWEILSRVPELGVTLDTGHAHINGEEPSSLLKRLGDRVSHVHLSNNRGERDEHSRPGDGTLDMGKFMRRAKESDVVVNLELNPMKYSNRRVLEEARALLKA